MSDISAFLLAGVRWVVWVVGGVALTGTLLPILRQTAWWIRVCDFPRLQIVAGLAVSLAAALAAWSVPNASVSIWWVSWVVTVVVILTSIRSIAAAHQRDRDGAAASRERQRDER